MSTAMTMMTQRESIELLDQIEDLVISREADPIAGVNWPYEVYMLRLVEAVTTHARDFPAVKKGLNWAYFERYGQSPDQALEAWSISTIELAADLQTALNSGHQQ